MMQLMRWTFLSTLVLTAGLALSACGGDDDDDDGGSGGINACFVQCADGMSGCTSGPGFSEADCQSSGASDCGGTPTEVVLQTGCECPGFGDPGECTSPPAWYQ